MARHCDAESGGPGTYSGNHGESRLPMRMQSIQHQPTPDRSGPLRIPDLLQLSLRLQGRTFGAPGLTAPAVEQCGRRKRSRGRTARVTRRRGPGVHPGSRRCGAAVFAASFGRKPYGAATAARGGPGDRPPAVPAVSRCRARQHHGQTVTLVPDAPIAMRCHRNRAGAPRIVRAGPSSLNGASHPAARDAPTARR